MSETKSPCSTTNRDSRWYDLFSRGGRDLLRHNEKVRQAVRNHIMDLAAGSDILSGATDKRVQVPVRFLEHHRFRLANRDQKQGVGQGEGIKQGDVLRQPQPGEGTGKGASGSGEGGLEFVLEFKVDELVEWLWEELELPNLKPRSTTIEDDEFTREGLDKRGPRARLDRRRSLKEAIKRRAVQPDGPAFTNDDLRFRQIVRKPRPSTHAVVFFALDVSSSVTEQERRLAKTFFFWALQGLRRQYERIETVFIAHTVRAWEFPEEEFFQARAQGGTVASTAFRVALEAIDERFDPTRYNIYLFYASDGENFADDREAALVSLEKLGRVANFMGYLETGRSIQAEYQTETARLFQRVAAAGYPVASYPLAEEAHIWAAIRHFFRRQAQSDEATV
jgi:uncharacterized sporulation protein YeaH/YhbH (DUF444 family)